MAAITEEQRIYLEASPRFQGMAQQYVKFIAQYLLTQDGTVGNLAGLSPVDWARQRFIAAGVALHPFSQQYNEWAAQMSMRLKGQDVWVPIADPDPLTAVQASIDATITAMINSGKFEELAKEIFALRGPRVEF